MYMDPQDSGWAIEDEKTRDRKSVERPSPAEPAVEAPEPPGISFDDATKEYTEAQRAAREDFRAEEPTASDFHREESTGGFSQSTTDVKARALGFVQPTDAPPGPLPSEL